MYDIPERIRGCGHSSLFCELKPNAYFMGGTYVCVSGVGFGWGGDRLITLPTINGHLTSKSSAIHVRVCTQLAIAYVD